MTNMNPSMRLKVKRDTFFVADPNGGVYFRNNQGSFRMEGRTIHQWIEQLMPAFNGEHTLADLTDGLPDRYRERVCEIAEVLYRNGFVRDISVDHPHQLADEVLKCYADQIEFLDAFADSGAYRFEVYRKSKVLAVGSGPFLASLVAALFESGLPKVHTLVTKPETTNRNRFMELLTHARTSDAEVVLEETTLQGEDAAAWQKAVQPFDAVLYVSEEGDVEALRILNAVCRENKRLLIPALCLYQAGVAGPLVHPDSDGCWESAWRRIHQAALRHDPQVHTFSSTAGAMLANVIVFELFKTMTGVIDSEKKPQFFLLNLETLEGTWHSFLPHPLINGCPAGEWISDLHSFLEQNLRTEHANGLLPFFGQITSEQAGIFHVWEEGDLKQLPLAQCYVQVADPRTDGPPELLPKAVCAGMTHEEARREAGLTGIETYVSRMVGQMPMEIPPHSNAKKSWEDLQEFIGIGVGETVAEGVCRGLQKCLTDELSKQQGYERAAVLQVQLNKVEDNHCRFYLQTLTRMKGTPVIGLGRDLFGFPVVWVRSEGRWFRSVGLTMTTALRNTLLQAVLAESTQTASPSPQASEVTADLLKDQPTKNLVIPACDEAKQFETLRSAWQTLERNHRQLLVFNLTIEPFLKDGFAGVYGVMVREEESP